MEENNAILSSIETLAGSVEQLWLEKVYNGVVANARILGSLHRFKIDDNHEADEGHRPDSLCLYVTTYGRKEGIKILLRSASCKFALVVDGTTKEFPFYRCADLINELGIQMRGMIK